MRFFSIHYYFCVYDLADLVIIDCVLLQFTQALRACDVWHVLTPPDCRPTFPSTVSYHWSPVKEAAAPRCCRTLARPHHRPWLPSPVMHAVLRILSFSTIPAAFFSLTRHNFAKRLRCSVNCSVFVAEFFSPVRRTLLNTKHTVVDSSSCSFNKMATPQTPTMQAKLVSRGVNVLC